MATQEVPAFCSTADDQDASPQCRAGRLLLPIMDKRGEIISMAERRLSRTA
jgi:hypothetical protein